jgi:hypothetical protein
MPSLQAKYLLLFVSIFSHWVVTVTAVAARRILTASASVTDLGLDLGSDSAANVRAYGSDSEHHAIALSLWDVDHGQSRKEPHEWQLAGGGWHGSTENVHLLSE